VQLEDEVNKCHVMLNDKDKKLSLSLHIYDLSLTIKQRDKELQQEKQKSEKMLNELYEYSKKVNQPFYSLLYLSHINIRFFRGK
jgi:hypothetical protein